MFFESDLAAIETVSKVVGRLRLEELEASSIVSVGKVLAHLADLSKRIEKEICDEKARAIMAANAPEPIAEPAVKKKKK